MIKAAVHKLGRAYTRKVVELEFERQKFRRHNERPLEFGYVFEKLAYLRPHTVLDVGAGDTALPHLIHNCGPEVTAIDNVHDYWPAGMINRHWHVIDDDILQPKLKRQFDMVTCISVIEHIVDHQTAFENLMAFVKPGGALIVTTPYSEYNAAPNVYKLEGAAYGKDEPYPCRSTSRKELNGWQRTGAMLVEQRFYQLWTGPVWTQGTFLEEPKQVSREETHQLSLMMFIAP